MGRSMAAVAGTAVVERYDKAAGNPFQKLGLQFLVERRGEGLFHNERCQDPQGRVVFDKRIPVDFAIGSGTRGRSYLVHHDSCLFQSPISWYSQKGTWDLSPGFERDYRSELPLTAGCLFCHCNQATPVEHTVNRYQLPFLGEPIGCERCHGPGELHVQRREHGEVIDGVDDTIINPRHLEPALREAVCQQCHLQGECRIVRRGLQPFDYRPGLPLHLFWSVFVRPAELTDNHKAVSHVEQMYASRCFRDSKGEMGCISCHDPHEKPAPEERVAYYRGRCLQCHQGSEGPKSSEKPAAALAGERAHPVAAAQRARPCGLPPAERRRRDSEDSCIGCHMPPFNTSNIAHTAATDHRILRKPEQPPSPATAAGPNVGEEIPLVHFHHDLVDPGDREVSRDLGLALIELAEGMEQTPARRQFGRWALPLVEEAVQSWPEDVPAWQAKGYALWLVGDKQQALAAFEAALDRAPERETALMYAATVATALGQEKAAMSYWQRALAVNPWAWRYHHEFAKLLAARHEWPRAIEECQAGLRLSPARVDTRILLVLCRLQSGDKNEARAEFDRALALHPPHEQELRRWFDEELHR